MILQILLNRLEPHGKRRTLSFGSRLTLDRDVTAQPIDDQHAVGTLSNESAESPFADQ